MVDRVVIINRGRLVVESPLDELTARLAGHGPRRGRRSRTRSRLALREAGVAATEREDGTVRVRGVTADRIGEIALAADVDAAPARHRVLVARGRVPRADRGAPS